VALGRERSFLDKQQRDLSGGEMQIVALLRALQLDPTILLLDEPTSALDAKTSEAAETLIIDWCNERVESRAIVWVSHDIQQARRVAQRVFSIEHGTLSKGS
jgi:putative ABC transport system ATP-binding protein